MRRGAIELPAVMIFIMVAGALILTFFIVLAGNQADSADDSIRATSLQRLDVLLKGAGTARETENNITIHEDTLLYECDETTGARLYYEDSVSRGVYNQILFSPQELAGGQLRTYSKGARAGYRVTTILYITTPSKIIQNTTDLGDFPQNFPLSSGTSERWRVVVPAYIDALNSHPDVVVVNEHPKGYGSVRYFTRGVLRGEAWYPNRELLYGALLSEDASTYTCILKQYLKQQQWVNGIERERLLTLKDASASSFCYAYYQEFPYADIAAVTEEVLSGEAFDEDEAERLAEAADQIEFMNDNLIRGGGGESCAWLH